MAFTRVVKVMRPIVPPDGPWRVFDQKLEHEELQEPTDWLREAMGGRMICFFVATWSADNGWTFTRRYKGKELHW
jgi:hypothetical protein